jgi:predicted secreted protein
LGSELLRAVEIKIAGDGNAAGRQKIETLLANEAAADEGDARMGHGFNDQ